MEEAITIACYRGYVMKKQMLDGGAMVAVGIIPVRLLPIFPFYCILSLTNESDPMVPLGLESRQLLEVNMKRFEGIRSQPRAIFFSSVTCQAIYDSPLGQLYWVTNLTSPVRFSLAVSNLLALNCDGILLEIGLHSILAGPCSIFVRLSLDPCNYVPSLPRGKNSLASFPLRHRQPVLGRRWTQF
jgi:hypothetical protein